MAEKPSFTQDYAITITLDPRIRSKGTAEQHIYMRSSLEAILKDRITSTVAHAKGLKAQEVPRPRLTLVAELTQSCDIHYHGIISFPMTYGLRCPYIFMRNIFRDKYLGNPKKMEQKDYIGYMVLRPIDNWDTWSEYISKTIDDFKTRVKLGPIICDDYEIYEAEDFLQYSGYSIAP